MKDKPSTESVMFNTSAIFDGLRVEESGVPQSAFIECGV